MKRIALTFFIGLIGWTAFGQFTLSQTVENPNPSLGSEFFGSSIAVEGDYMVVGAPFADARATNAGMAYLYHYDGNSWNRQTVLIPHDTLAFASFGYDVAIEDSVIVVGTSIKDAGGIYFFERDGAIWPDTLVSTQSILKSDVSNSRGLIGTSVDISGDFVAFGSPTYGVTNSSAGGQVYIYKKAAGDKWSDNTPVVVRRIEGLHRSVNSSSAGFGWDVRFMKDADQLLVFNYAPFNGVSPGTTNGVVRFVNYSTYTSFASVRMSDSPSPYFQIINDTEVTGVRYGGSRMSYSDSVLVYENKVYRLDNTGNWGNFVSEGSLEGDILEYSVGLSEGGHLITALVQGTDSLELVCYKKTTANQWGQDTKLSKKITLSNNRAVANTELYMTLPIATNTVKDYRVIVGAGEANTNSTTDVGEVREYTLDISPQLLGYFPESGATGIKFQSDTTLNAIFDCSVQPDATAQIVPQIVSSGGSSVITINLQSSTDVVGHEVRIPLSKDVLIADFFRISWLIFGDFTDAYGLTLNLSATVANFFLLGNITPPTFTTTYTNAENQFARGTFTVDLQANDEIDTVAGNTIEVANASISAITRVSTRNFQFDVTPDFNVGDPDKLNQLSVKIPNTFFADTAANVAVDSVIIAVDYSQSVVRKGGFWLDGVPGNTYVPVSTDNVFISENFTATSTNLTMNNLIIGDTVMVNLEGEVALEVDGDLLCEGSLTVTDSASLFLRKNYTSGDSIFIKSGASLYTYEGFNHLGQIHAERKNSFDLGQYSFVGTPFEESESNDTDAFGSYVYAYDPTQRYGTDGLDQWVDASAQTIIPGRGYTSSSTDTLRLSGIPSTGTVEVANLKYEPASSTNTANLGWQLLSNPYLAPLRVDEMWAANEEALEVEAIYLWDDGGSNQGQRTNSDYLVYNSLGTVGGANGKTFNGMLMPFQAFMIKLKDSIVVGSSEGSVTTRVDRSFLFEEDMRAATGGISGNFFRNTEPAKLRLRVSSQDGLWSETLIGFTEDATNSFDAKYDAYFRPAKDLAIFSLLDDSKLAIQGLPIEALTKATEIPLGLSSEGNLTLAITELDGLSDVNIYLKNSRTGEELALKPEVSHTLFASGDLIRDYSIVLKPLEILGADDSAFDRLTVWGTNGQLSVAVPGLTELHEVNVFDLSGRLRFSKQMLFDQGQAKSSLDLEANQVYILEVEGQSIKFILKQ